LVSFFDYELGIADYIDITINGALLRRIYSASDNLYSVPLYNGDIVTVTYYSPSGSSVSSLTLIKREFTSENIDGNLGIVDTQVANGETFTSYTFTVSISSKAYDFDYLFNNSIITQFQLLAEDDYSILTENSDYINVENNYIPPVVHNKWSSVSNTWSNYLNKWNE